MVRSPTGARRRALAGAGRGPGRGAGDDDRFTARVRRRRRASWRRILIGVVVVAVVAGLGWLVWFSPYVVVRQVEVEGVTGAEATAVAEIAAVPLGRPLARVDTGAVTARVRERLTIAEARTSRSWPSTIVVHVRPRTPALVLQNPQGQLEVVDATGVAYDQVAEAPAGVPLVTASSDAGTTEGALRAALSLIHVLPVDLARRVSTINVSSASLVTFTLGEVQVTWGGEDRPARKVEVLEALLKTSPAAVDVSAPDNPTTR